jgi:hypothetical protein
MGSSGSEPPESGGGDDPGTSDDRDATTGQDGLTTEELREQVERKYDFCKDSMYAV